MKIEITDIPAGHKIERINIDFSHDSSLDNSQPLEVLSTNTPTSSSKPTSSVSDSKASTQELIQESNNVLSGVKRTYTASETAPKDDLEGVLDDVPKKERPKRDIPSEMTNASY